MTPHEQTQCAGKQRFAERRLAQQIRTRIQHRGRKGMNVYRCPWCQQWHVGSRVPVRTTRVYDRRREPSETRPIPLP